MFVVKQVMIQCECSKEPGIDSLGVGTRHRDAYWSHALTVLGSCSRSALRGACIQHTINHQS